MSNQAMYNSILADGDVDDQLFAVAALGVLRRAYLALRARDLFSVQPVLEPADCFYVLSHHPEPHLEREECIAQAMRIDCPSVFALSELHKAGTQVAQSIDRLILGEVSGLAEIQLAVRLGKDRRRTLAEVIHRAADDVGKQSRRGRANWIVTSPELAPDLPVGLDTYVEPSFPSSMLLLGYKGNHPCDSGYFFCPHTMLIRSDHLNLYGDFRMLDESCYAVIHAC
jgi:hypothetical protein